MLLSSLIDPISVEVGVQVENTQEVLERLVDLAEESGGVTNRKAVLKSLIEREQLCSTAVGKGVAIPHPKESLPGAVTGVALAVLRLNEGLNMDAPDKEPVKLFFLMGAEDRREHLQILGTLARLLKNDGLRRELMTATSAEEFVDRLSVAETSMNREEMRGE